jgi:hypothetical protein
MLRGAYSVAPGRTYARFGFRRNTLLWITWNFFVGWGPLEEG